MDLITLNDAEKSCIATFLDTDGTLTMRTRRMENGRLWLEMRLIWFNCEEKEILKYLKSIIGFGCVTTAERPKKNYHAEYKFVVSRFKQVEGLLKEIVPFMHLQRKKRIAFLLLEACEIRKETKRTQHPIFKYGERFNYPKRMFEIQEEITELNK